MKNPSSTMFSTTPSLLLLAFLLPAALAWPTAPGSCLSPQPLLGSSHLTDGQYAGGTALADFGLSVKIGDDVLDPAISYVITTGTDYSISLASSSSSTFRGFLFRLGKDGVDASDFLTATTTAGGGDANVQAFSVCNPAAGLAHTNNTDKMSVEGMLSVPDAIEALELEVTVVIVNNDNDGSEWYASAYMIDAVSAGTENAGGSTSDPPTAPPSASASPSITVSAAIAIGVGLFMFVLA